MVGDQAAGDRGAMTAMAGQASSSPGPPGDALPPLRENLKILPDDTSDSGESWMIQDPVRNLYFQIGWREFSILACWHHGDPSAVVAAVQSKTALDIDEQDIEDVRHFLEQNELITLSGPQDFNKWREKRAIARKQSILTWVQKGMFLRIPLLRSTAPVLRSIESLAGVFFRPGFWIMVGLAALVGGYMALRQWDAFLANLVRLASLEGATYSVMAIAFAKICHEFAHASTAHRYGVKVPTMGVAFMVFWPVLYSDTTDSWRLFDRTKRLRIAAAGVLVELALASFALLAWGVLPQGALRDGVFVLASVAWVMTIMINLNPLMKFDGYYLLSDWLAIDNLHPRAFAMGKWLLRRILFGLHLPCPEPDVSRAQQRFLIILCYAVWLYRIFLALGIAFLIYAFLFKALGIVIMVMAMMTLLGIPIYKEMREIWMQREKVKTLRRPLMTGLGVCLILAVVIVPWYGRIPVSALLQAGGETIIYPPISGRLLAVEVLSGDTVAQNDILFRLESPQLEWDIERLETRVRSLALRIARVRGSTTEIKQEPILRRQFASAFSELKGLQEQQEQLVIRAPFVGRVMEMNADLRAGLWVRDDLPLAVLADTADHVAVAYLKESDLRFVRPGDQARFYPNAPDMAVMDMVVSEINPTSAQILTDTVLAAPLGGDVPIQRRETSSTDIVQQSYIPQTAVFRLRMQSTAPASNLYALRGTAYIDGEKRSIIGALWRWAAAVFIRESGF